MVKIRASRAARYAKHLTDLGVRKALYIMQHNHRPRTIRKLGKRGLEPVSQLTAFRRIPKGIRYGVGELLRVPYLSPPGQIERRVCDNPIEPRGERLCRIEPIDCLISAQEPLLHRILGILVRVDDRARYHVRPPLVQTHEPGKTPLIPLPGETYELSLLIRNTCG